MNGVFTGVLDVYYAEMTTADTASTAPVYGNPAILGKAIEVTITPTVNEGQLSASNKRVKWTKKITGYEISMNTDNVDPAVLAKVLGRTSTTAKVQYVNSAQVIPNIALGFCATYDDGTKELWWIYKCQCAEITRDMKTEEGDNVEYNTPTLEAVAMPLLNNGNLAAVCDTNVVTTASIASGWFSAVFLADPA